MVYKNNVSETDAPSHAVYPFVTGRYRSGGSYIDNIKSIFRLHTEFVNAWTMIIASTASVLATSFVSVMGILDKEAILIFATFTASAVLHLPFSLGYHLFMSMDVCTFNMWRRMDVIAIFQASVLLTFSLSYFVLPWWGCVLNTFIACGISSLATIRFWHIPVDHVINGGQQSAFVGSIISCYCFPMVYGLLKDATRLQFTMTTVTALGVLATLAFSGWVYASWWPQRRAPGRFNVWFHSHQIMHIGVMVCHALEFLFIWDNWRKTKYNIYM